MLADPEIARRDAAESRSRVVSVLNVLVGAAARTGGIAPFVGGAATELQKRGASVSTFGTDLALAPSGFLQRQRRIRAEEWHPALAAADTQLFRARFPRRLAYSPALASALNRASPGFDVIHIHNLWQFPQFAAYRAAVRHDVPYIVSPHGGLDPYLRQRGRVRKRMTAMLWQDEMLRRAALIHVTTQAERDLIADVVPHVPRAVVPCGLDVHQFSSPPARHTFRRRHLRGYEGALILFLGRITQKKGLDVLIRAFAHARQACECRLAIVGPDDEGLLPALRELAHGLHIHTDMDFLPPLYGDDRLAALASADVWALPSHAENFGIAVVEAMAAGCAVVTAPGVNIAPEIAAASAGVVADAQPEVFGAMLVRILKDRDLRESLRARAPRFAARYDWSAVAPQLLEMYRDAGRTR